MTNSATAADDVRPIVIAHRGASGYLPEHTLAAKSLAHAMGADYLEQDVVLSKDGEPIVLHDIHLDTVTDVREQFPNRVRKDGRFYAIDFTAREIGRLNAHERIDLKTGRPVFPERFPLGKGRFHVPTLREELELVQGINRGTGREVGVYVEIKAPAWHRQEGKDSSAAVLELLDEFGYRRRADKCFVQCFDPRETRRLREELKTDLKLIQLIGENRRKEAAIDYDKLRTREGLKTIAEYADGIGPRLEHLVIANATAVRVDPLVGWAKEAGLALHPYTFRADSLPEFHALLGDEPDKQFDALLQLFFEKVKVEGLFTDFPDRAIAVRDAQSRAD